MVLVIAMNALGKGCDKNLNIFDGRSPECNYAGVCLATFFGGGTCSCCDSTRGSTDPCGGKMQGTWNGHNCNVVTSYLQVLWHYDVIADELTCTSRNDFSATSVPDLLYIQTMSLADDYNGEIRLLGCRSCTVAEPCGKSYPGIRVEFKTDFSAYYDPSCSYNKHCAANWDYGTTAFKNFTNSIDLEDEDFLTNFTPLEYNGEDGQNLSSKITASRSEEYTVSVAVINTKSRTTRTVSSSDPTNAVKGKRVMRRNSAESVVT